ncbi:MAG: hypothetical protein ACFB9N_19030 [Geitlerinemataceae cyanobacterium]
MQSLESASFLSPEDAARVDAALLTNRDKFLARLAIYAQRSLHQISRELEMQIEDIGTPQVADWIARDPSVRETVDVDASFASFFTNLVLAARSKLEAASRANNTTLDALSVEQTIAWFESQSKPEGEPEP